MLYLNISEGDKVMIGEGEDAIIVTLERKNMGRGKIRLGVNAPTEVPVNTIFADSSQQFKNRQRRTTNPKGGNEQ